MDDFVDPPEPESQGEVDAETVAIEITTYQSRAGRPLTKLITKRPDGGGIASDASACVLGGGMARRTVLGSMAALADHIAGLGSDEAIGLGRLRAELADTVPVTTPARPREGAITRSGDNLLYAANQPGVMLVDYDSKQMTDPVRRRIAAVGGVESAIASIVDLTGIGCVLRASTSAGLMVDGTSVPGSDGKHVYILVRDATDIPRALRALHDRAWLDGLGWMAVGGAGRALERSVVDRMVYGAERLIFEGGPRLGPGLTQDEAARRRIAVEGRALDTLAAIRDLNPNEKGELARLKKLAKEAIAPEMARVRAAWVERQTEVLVARGATPEVARRAVEKLADGGVLVQSMALLLDDDAEVTVAEILKNPEAYVGATLCDPLEGREYGRNKAQILRRSDGTLWVFSYAHGGVTYDVKFDLDGFRALVWGADKADSVDVYVRNRKHLDAKDLDADQFKDELRSHLGYDKKKRDFATLLAKAEARARAALDTDDAGEGSALPRGFWFSEDGLFHRSAGSGAHFVAAQFSLLAMVRSSARDDWSILVRWRDADGVEAEWAVPQRFSAHAFSETIDNLSTRGLRIATDDVARKLLARFFAQVTVEARLLTISTPGWIDTERGPTFVLPGGEAIGPGAALIHPTARLTAHAAAFHPRGTLKEWQDEVGVKAVGNTRAILTTSTAFAGPLLRWLNEESRLLHLFGESGAGKTTFCTLPASVYSNPDPKVMGLVKDWYATANAHENGLADANDLFCMLDEMNKAPRGAVGKVAYMFAGGTGKGRMNADTSARNTIVWRTFGVSNGEQSLAAKMMQDGETLHAGQERRCISVPADGGKGMGVVEDLHGDIGPAEFIDGLKDAVLAQHGTAGRAYLDQLVAEVAANKGGLLDRIAKWRDGFMQNVPATAGSQVGDVAGVFGLVGAAGELAIHYKVAPWPPGEAMRAAQVCFEAWLDGREGGVGQAEDAAFVALVREGVRTYQHSRFVKLFAARTNAAAGLGADPEVGLLTDTSQRPNHLFGYWDDTTPVHEFWLYPGALAEICHIPRPQLKEVARALRAAGVLIPEKGNNDTHTRRLRLGKVGQLRMYCVSGAILDGGVEGETGETERDG